jgi:hypothetical protein
VPYSPLVEIRTHPLVAISIRDAGHFVAARKQNSRVLGLGTFPEKHYILGF